MTSTDMPTVAEMMRELDAIAAQNGITWTGAEVAGNTDSERTRYAAPGQRVGRGYVRTISSKQVALIERLFAERDLKSVVFLPGSENYKHMSLAGARDLIDRLFAAPLKPESERKALPVKLASDKQLHWIKKTGETKSYTDTQVIATVAKANKGEDVTAAEAKYALDILFSSPDKPREILTTVKENTAKSADERIDGIYAKDGKIYKVQYNQSKTGLYGKLFVPENSTEAVWDESGNLSASGTVVWEYAGSFARLGLTAADKMSFEEAKKFGALYGTCINCSRTLTNEESIEAGIGPVCRTRFS